MQLHRVGHKTKRKKCAGLSLYTCCCCCVYTHAPAVINDKSLQKRRSWLNSVEIKVSETSCVARLVLKKETMLLVPFVSGILYLRATRKEMKLCQPLFIGQEHKRNFLCVVVGFSNLIENFAGKLKNKLCCTFVYFWLQMWHKNV